MLDTHAVLSLQHAAEAFFLIHSFTIPPKELTASSTGSAEQQVPILSAIAIQPAQEKPSIITTQQEQPSTSKIAHSPSVQDWNLYQKNMIRFAGVFRSSY